MVFPIEILHWDILPSIRAKLVCSMKNKGLKQNEIAVLFDMTPSAISQYLNEKRGKFLVPKEFEKEIEISADKILNKQSTVFTEINLLLKQFEKKHLCKICTQKNNIKSDCKICFE